MQRLITTLIITCSMFFSAAAFAGSVSRAQFTTEVIDREPVDQVDSLTTDQRQIKYFTELSDLQGHNVTHQWVYNDEIMFEKSFDVGSARWRIWTSKTLQPGWTGVWTVNTLDQDRSKLMTQTFTYQD